MNAIAIDDDNHAILTAYRLLPENRQKVFLRAMQGQAARTVPAEMMRRLFRKWDHIDSRATA
ncbi:MAG: hypothetical protein WCJ64_18810 [Rhodospirillaceae bacterium]